jgi:hypothetical protein
MYVDTHTNSHMPCTQNINTHARTHTHTLTHVQMAAKERSLSHQRKESLDE